jgi:hypothetical protein
VVVLVGVVSLMSVVTLRKDFASRGANLATLSLARQSVVSVHEWTCILGPQFCAGFENGILLGHLMNKSGLVPRPMAILGLFVGVPLAFLSGILILLGVGARQSGLLVLFTIPEVVWETFIAIYCTSKDLRPSPSSRISTLPRKLASA